MNIVRAWLGGMALVVSANAVSAAQLPAKIDAAALSAEIDRHIEARWAEKNLKPAPLADDAEFFRRLFLDLNGRIPPVAQLRDFLDDRRADKRRRWVDVLMSGRDNREWYANQLAAYWQRLLFSRTRGAAPGDMASWLRKQVASNTPYDQMVRELLGGSQAEAFYRVHENQPEKIAAEISRLFLCIKLECAQCHDDRSGGRWTQTQFWELAAFFTSDARAGKGPAEIAIPDQKKTVNARFLDGNAPELPKGVPAPVVLARWATDRDNAYFARAAANRLWAYFFGVGLVEPVDAAGPHNPPSHAALLDALAGQLMAHDFDVQYLIRAITGSHAYQRSSARPGAEPDDPRVFTRMTVRPMTGEQLFDSLAQATGLLTFQGTGRSANLRGEFLARFAAADDTAGTPDTSILQALYLMNGRLIAEATSPQHSKTLQVIAGAGPAVSNAVRVRELYLATLSREPTAEELKRSVAYVDRGGAAKDRTKALADVLWVLLNSGEFVLNH
jgi:hypothetical protein